MQERKFNINGHPNDIAALETLMAYINLCRRDKQTGSVTVNLHNDSLLPSFTEADGAVIWQEDDSGALDIPIEPVRVGGKRLPVADFETDGVLLVDLGVNNEDRETLKE